MENQLSTRQRRSAKQQRLLELRRLNEVIDAFVLFLESKERLDKMQTWFITALSVIVGWLLASINIISVINEITGKHIA